MTEAVGVKLKTRIETSVGRIEGKVRDAKKGKFPDKKHPLRVCSKRKGAWGMLETNNFQLSLLNQRELKKKLKNHNTRPVAVIRFRRPKKEKGALRRIPLNPLYFAFYHYLNQFNNHQEVSSEESSLSFAK